MDILLEDLHVITLQLETVWGKMTGSVSLSVCLTSASVHTLLGFSQSHVCFLLLLKSGCDTTLPL